ncbi:3-ketoacyl-CoA thiolase [candidate division CSSED10-310 bacterium]|uniref:3-ketoacyl-CoA thiolase n=1 Tax=candidate division CSSED10-310 bacterium TaxID=2855610 RepID=A0ABV6YY61_UNCC1
MNKLRKRVFCAAGYNTVSLGTGRKEFHPKKTRPGLEHYIIEAGKGVLDQIGGAQNVDEGVISNFMAARFNRQGNLAGIIPMIDPDLEYLPCTRVEGACGSGGMALYTSMKSILAETADVVLSLGVEVQNSVKAIYGADILAGAGHYASERKQGHAYFFPSKFSDRAGALYEKFGYDTMRTAMAHWYVQAVENARRCPKAQEHHNANPDLFSTGMMKPNPKGFVDHLNVFDCSKVSDGASALVFTSEEGLNKIGISKQDAVELVGYGQVEANLSQPPKDPTRLTTSKTAVDRAYEMAGLTARDIGVLEVHDCFTVSGLLSLEAAGMVQYGEWADFVTEGRIHYQTGDIPTNASGGLVGFGHYTGGTGVRQAVDCLDQLTGKAGDYQVKLNANKPYALMISMGGNDKTVTAMIFRKAE